MKIEASRGQAEPQESSGPGFLRPRVKLAELVIFAHQMATLVSAGISIARAMRSLAESSRNPYLEEVILDVAGNLEGGMDLATSMGQHADVFDDLFISLIHVGENTGRLDEAFLQVAGYLELERETRRRLKAATRYPMFVMISIGIAIVVLNVFVIPAFADVFAKYSAELPWQTRAILAVSNFFVTYWWVLLLVLAALFQGLRRYVASEQGRLQWDRWKMRIPILGSIYERIYLARFCHTFAMVSRAGVPVSQGLTIVARAVGNAFMERKIMGMRSGIERGEGITATARAAAMFSPVVLQMMSVGEETGAMDRLLDQAAGFYEDEVEYELKGLTDALEPILIIAIAALVLVMALGVFLPMWDLSSVAR